ncbi:MAG: hypothetical protein IT257_01855, partial [Chitinophagaceae bacterium]|nr:hypothetical protein [Chitinophagaceae bacterium]
MKQITLFVFLLCAHFIALSQVTGLKNVPGDYATLELAIADLNTVGVGPGGATINILPGNPQTAPVNGYQLGSGVLNPTLLAANPLIINGNGNTATANTGVGLYDAIFILKGADYVTIDGLNLIENGANVNSTMWMEWGYALLKRQNVAPFDGCQNNIIQNCNITLNRAHGSLGYGIYANNHIPLTNTQLTLSSINDANSFNTFRANTIQNVNSGILLQGSTNALYYDLNNIVGGTNGANGNIIQNFGNNAAIVTYGIYTFYQNNLLIQNNNLNNMNGGGVAPTTTQYGIYTSTATFSGFYTIRKNTVNLTQGSTGIVYGIYNTASNTNNLNTINIDSNDVAFTHITTGSTVYGIYNSGSCANLNLNANKMNNISTPGTGTMYLFYIAGTVYTSEVVNDNKITNFTRTGASGATYGIYFPGPGVGNANVTASFQRNKIDRMFYSNAANAGAMYSIYAYRAACVKTVKNDTVINCRNNAGTRYGFYTYNYNTGSEVSNNYIANDTSSGSQFGLYLASSTYTNTAVSDNIITGFYNAGTTTSMYGLYCTGGTNLNIHRNNIHNMQSQITTAGALYGMYCTAGVSVNLYNNFLSNFRTPVASSTSPIYGIYFSAGGVFKLFHNTIKLDPVSVGPNFGATGIYFTATPTLDLRNNIIHVNATPLGTGFVAALRKSAGVAGTPPAVANIAAASNSNIFYTPTLANSYWYAEGTSNPLVNAYNLLNDVNMNTSCANYKVFMSPRESSSFHQNNLTAVALNPPTWAPAGLSFGKSNAVATAAPAVTTDYALAVRALPADCGALQYAGPSQDAVGPTITYTPITTISDCGGLPILTATITDISGVNTAAGTKPRVYYKKSTDNNVLLANNNVSNGWKWVEATNASSPFEFQLNPALLTSAPVLGDVIQYFVVAQDNVVSPNPNVSSKQVAYASGYCPVSVDLLAGAFPTAVAPVINSMTVNAAVPYILTASASPINVCNPGTTTLSVADTVNAVGNSLPSSAFNWAPGAGIVTNPNRVVTGTNIVANTTYTVTATDPGGCTWTNTVSVALAQPFSAISVTGTTAYCNDVPNTTLTFNTTGGSSPVNTIWTGGPLVSPTVPMTIVNNTFADAYAPANWTTVHTGGGNGTTNAAGAPANIVHTGTTGPGGSYSRYQTTVTGSGTLSFSWNVVHNDPNWDGFGYYLNGTYTQLTAVSASGNTSIPVNPGDIFAFYSNAFDNFAPSFTATITNFSAPKSINVVSGNTAIVNPLPGTTIYTVTAVDPCGNTVSTTVSVTVTIPPVPTVVMATPATICPGATSNLNAISAGNQIIYYDQAVGGIPLGFAASGVNFPVTPLVTTTYYASAASQFLPSGSQTFNYTGAPQTFIVPPGVTSVTINAFGAQGFGQPGAVAPISVPGNGGRAQGLMSVVPGQTLTVYVGGQGQAPSNGWNGGGLGKGGVNGGGASDVRTGGVSLADRVIVAGGGGGAGGDSWQCLVGGGHGGGGIAVGSNFVGGGGGAGYTSGTGCGTDGGNAGGIGGSGTHGGGGGGGGLVGGGTGAVGSGPAFPGTLGQGGASFDGSSCVYTGGGGGGYYGGGGAAGNNCGAGRGGGGSSWTGTLLNPVFQGGVQTGNGQVIISWSGGTICESARVPVTVTTLAAPVVTASVNPVPACASLPITLTGTGALTYNWNPGGIALNPATIPAPLVATTYTVTGTDAGGCTATSTVAVTVNPTPNATITQSPANPLACGVIPTLTAPIGQVSPPPGARYYIRDADPWGSAAFTTGLNAVFGAGNYIATTYALATPATVFVPGTQFVYLEGSSGTEAGQTAYLAANLPLIETWVNNGGRLLINRAPNSGAATTNFGFGGVTNNYSNAQGTVNVTALDPIGAGPFVPAGYGPFTGSSYSHA